MSKNKTNQLPWALLGIILFLVTVTVNALANALPLFGRLTGQISDGLPNLFVPSGLTFAVWGPIYLALLIFTLYQFVVVLKNPTDPPLWWKKSIGSVLLGHLANALWIVSWHALWYEASLVLMLVLFGSLVRVVLALGWSQNPPRGAAWAMAVLPFSLYLGWITVALPANITGLLVHWGLGNLAPDPLFWAAGVSFIAAVLGIIVSLRYKDPIYPLVISWALFGIALKRSSDLPWLSGWAMALAALCLLLAAGAFFRRIVGDRKQ